MAATACAVGDVALHGRDLAADRLDALDGLGRSRSGSRSTAKIFAPSSAKRTAVARPLPQPGPTQPAPATSAILPSSLPAMVSL